MDDLTLAYLAGFIDGEGSIAINIRKYRRSDDETARIGGSLRLSAHQLDPRPIRLLAQVFGGSVRRHGYRKLAEKRDLFEWHISSDQAYAALKAMRPWLIVKADQADLGMQYQEMLRARTVPRTTRLTDEEQQAREAIHLELKRLKWETFYEATEQESTPPAGPKPKPPKMIRVKTAIPIRSDQGRSGRPAKGQSKKPDAATLAAEYHALGPAEVARRYGTSRQTVYNWLDGYQIPRLPREAGEQRRLAALKGVWQNPDGVH